MVTLRERERELEQLGHVLERAADGRGGLAFVEGAAGTGKSALVAAIADRARGAEMRALSARGGELEQGFAFGAIRQLFEPVVRTAGSSEQAVMFDGAAAAAVWVLSSRSATEEDHSAARFAAMRAIYWLASNLATVTPLLLVVDDAHWVDASSLRFLSFLARRIGELPIALLVATREDEPGAPAELLDELRLDPEALRLTVRSLGADSSAAIVRDQLPDAGDELCVAAHAAAAGNPLYLRELIRALDTERLPAAGAVAAIQDAWLPSLGERIARRIARVAPGASSLTIAMSALGDGGGLATAARLAGLDDRSAAAIAARLRRLEILAAEDPFEFVHPLVRRSVYDLQSLTDRDLAHRTAAALLREDDAPVEAVAAQLRMARPAGSAAAATALTHAAQQALARAAPDEAVAWLLRALEEEAASPTRSELLERLGNVSVAMRAPAAIGYLQDALALAEEPDRRARIAAALTEILANVGQWDAARELIAGALEEHRDGEPGPLRELTAIHTVLAAYDAELAPTLVSERARLTRLCEGDDWAAHALASVLAAVASMCGESEASVLALVDRALEGDRLLSERAAGAWASAQVLGALIGIDASERAAELLDRLELESRACGSPIGLMTALGYRGWMAARQGDLVAGEGVLRTGLAMVVEAEMPMVFLTAAWFLSDAMLERPSLDDVSAMVDAVELEPMFLNTWSGGMLLELRGRLRLARHDDQAGIADLRGAARIAAAIGLSPPMSSWRSTLALALGREDSEEADELVAEELRLARRNGAPRGVAIALRAAGILDPGRVGIEQLRASLSLVQDSPARLECARTLVELGSALRRRSLRAEARGYLRAGLEQARDCGAERLAARAQEELRVAGGRVRTLSLTGVDALTASEVRVGRLAAVGRTNAQIAQELYVSRKTVETHLSSVYGKLGLSGQGSRGRLTESFNRNSPPDGH